MTRAPKLLQEIVDKEGRGQRKAIYKIAGVTDSYFSRLLSGEKPLTGKPLRNLAAAFPERRDALWEAAKNDELVRARRESLARAEAARSSGASDGGSVFAELADRIAGDLGDADARTFIALLESIAANRWVIAPLLARAGWLVKNASKPDLPGEKQIDVG